MIDYTKNYDSEKMKLFANGKILMKKKQIFIQNENFGQKWKFPLIQNIGQ